MLDLIVREENFALGITCYEVDGFQAFDYGPHGVKHFFLSGISENPDAATHVDQVTAQVAALLKRPFNWFCGHSYLSPQAKVLERHTGMELELHDLKTASSPLNVQFEWVQRDFTGWCSVLGKVYEFEEEVEAYGRLYQDKADFYHLIAKVDGAAVSAGSLHCIDGTAALHNICTLPSYKRQGIATKLTHSLLDKAKELGCTTALLHASKEAETLYARLGFKPTRHYYTHVFGL